MSLHEAGVRWECARRAGSKEGETPSPGPLAYDEYSRDHLWTFPGGIEVPASAAPEFPGGEGRVDPEQAFVAALSSCHMLTFLVVAARKRIGVECYEDSAQGHLEKNGEGSLALTRVLLRPRIQFADSSIVDDVAVDEMHRIAHENCFIANSVRTEILVEGIVER